MQIPWNQQPLYHGSNQTIKNPDLQHSRIDIDFGPGFYTTNDILMAKKWSSSKTKSIINMYRMPSINNLNIYQFDLSEEWLHYIKANRGYGDNIDTILNQYSQYDIIIGPTADDKLFSTIQEYLDEMIDAYTTLHCLNAAKYSNQIVFKTEKAIQQLKFQETLALNPIEQKEMRQLVRQTRTDANLLVKKIKQEYFQAINEYMKNKE